MLSAAEPFGELTDADGTVNRLGRVADPAAIEAFQAALAPAELLIADGHHRYETARVYADEVGGEGEHRYVLMCLVALQDEGLTVFPTHRLIRDTTPQTQEALGSTLRELFTVEEIDQADLRPPDGAGPLTMGYLDSFFKRGFRLTLKDQASADRALADMPEAYRHLDTAVLEALVLNGPLGLSEDDISHLKGLGYSRTDERGAAARALRRVRRRLLPALDAHRAGAGHCGSRCEYAPQVDVLLPQGPDGAALQSAAITRGRRIKE